MVATLHDSEIYLQKAKLLAKEFAKDAAERDKQGGTPKVQRDLIRESGLLKLLIPKEFGGEEQPWSVVLEVIREFSKADASLGHLYGYHFLCLAGPYLAGTPKQIQYYFSETAKHNYFWGNSSNPLEKSIIGKREGDKVIVNGAKSFSSGSPDSDLLIISWNDEETGEYYEGIIPTSRQGVYVHDDWDNMGQRQTGSGKVSFDHVVLNKEEVLPTPYAAENVFSTIIPILSQSILTNIFIGSALGAIEEAKAYTLTQSRPWYTSGYEKASQDPWIISKYGDFWIEAQSALSFVEKAELKLDQVWEKGLSLTEEERGECAVFVAAANVLAGNVSLSICNSIFEVMGARSSAAKYGYDRFWRNVRTHTLHNPVEYKKRTVGNWALNGEFPKYGFYS